MPLDPVPFVVGGGAHHSPEVFRAMVYAATSGAEGIVQVRDLKVTALSNPGSSVQVGSGAAVIRNRYATGAGQSYVARAEDTTLVAVSPTGASGPRSDLVVLRIEDPSEEGTPWTTLPTPETGPYVFLRVIPNVPPGTTSIEDVPGYEGGAAVTLARIDLPQSTTNITNAMIKDLRKVAIPRRESVLRVVDPPNDRKIQNNTNWHNWPTIANEFLNVPVPEWATQMQVVCIISGIAARGNTWGSLRCMVGTVGAVTGTWDTTVTTTNDPFQFMAMMAAETSVPAEMRGTSVPIGMDARVGSTGQTAANLPWTTDGTRISVQIEFLEVPV